MVFTFIFQTSKDIYTDASPDTPSDDDNTNVIETTPMINTESENKLENILRKQSRDAEAQTKARESRDSFRCRGCGVESNRQRFEEEVRGYEFTADHVGQRSMSDTFKVYLILPHAFLCSFVRLAKCFTTKDLC